MVLTVRQYYTELIDKTDHFRFGIGDLTDSTRLQVYSQSEVDLPVLRL